MLVGLVVKPDIYTNMCSIISDAGPASIAIGTNRCPPSADMSRRIPIHLMG
jgi:hypothetical protein